MKVTQKDIAEYLGIDERNVRAMKKNNPKKYELVELGCICKKNSISKDKLVEVIELVEKIKALP